MQRIYYKRQLRKYALNNVILNRQINNFRYNLMLSLATHNKSLADNLGKLFSNRLFILLSVISIYRQYYIRTLPYHYASIFSILIGIKHNFWAALFILSDTLIKWYGIIGLFFFTKKNRINYIMHRSLKTLPCVLIWFYTSCQLFFKEFNLKSSLSLA